MTKDEIDTMRERVLSFCDQRKYQEALEIARSLLSPDRTEAEQAEGLSMHAYIMRMQKELGQALAYRQKARVKNPADRGIEHGLMRNLVDCGHYAEAIESAERLMSLDRDTEWQPFTDSAHLHKAYALYKLGRLEEAEREFALVKEEGNIWIDRRLTTKALLLDEIARSRGRKR
jgi:tetratricopeptide (TPR) repeat protein